MDLERTLRELRAATRPTMRVLPQSRPPPRVVALLPGSFDPPTIAHSALADAAGEFADLVLLVYSVRTMPKEEEAGLPLLPEGARIDSVRRLCATRPERLALALCSHGLLAEQAAAAREAFPDARLVLVMGSDKVVQLLDARWYEDRDAVLDELFTRVTVRYAVRQGDAAVEAALTRGQNARWRDRFVRLEAAADVAAVSSRLVREVIRGGRDPSALVPPAVLPVLRERLNGMPAGEPQL
jgi:nicotinic acid mononucleotide adenylyltransferase